MKRNFSVDHLGLIYIGKFRASVGCSDLIPFQAVSVGILIGAVIFVWLSRDMGELVKKWKGFPPPEGRLTGGIIAGPLMVIGCFWLGWTGEYSYIPWYVPMLSTVLIGCAVNLMFASFLVSFSFSFVELVLIRPLELLDGHIFVSHCPWTLFLVFTIPQECTRRLLSPSTRCSVVPLAARSLYLPRRCLKGSVRISSPLGDYSPVFVDGRELGVHIVGSDIPHPLPYPDRVRQIWSADTP